MVEPDPARRSRRRRDLVYAAHLALAAALGIGWALRNGQESGLAGGARFAAGSAARAAAFLAVSAGTAALVVIAVGTFLERRDAKLLLLVLLLAGAIGWRKEPDALDAVYAIAATALAAAWFLLGRRALDRNAGPAGPATGDPRPKPE